MIMMTEIVSQWMEMIMVTEIVSRDCVTYMCLGSAMRFYFYTTESLHIFLEITQRCGWN